MAPITIEYDHGTFEALVISTLGVMPNYTYMACMSWCDHGGYTPGAELAPIGPSRPFVITHADIAAARATLDDLYQAAAAYQALVVENGGSDPYIEDHAFGADLEDVGLLAARIKLWSALEFKVRETLLALLERGAIEPGAYSIRPPQHAWRLPGLKLPVLFSPFPNHI